MLYFLYIFIRLTMIHKGQAARFEQPFGLLLGVKRNSVILEFILILERKHIAVIMIFHVQIIFRHTA